MALQESEHTGEESVGVKEIGHAGKFLQKVPSLLKYRSDLSHHTNPEVVTSGLGHNTLWEPVDIPLQGGYGSRE